MADKRDERDREEREREEGEGRPKIHIVDRRMLNEDERTGKVATTGISSGTPPRLEMVGGGSATPTTAQQPQPNQSPDAPPENEEQSDEPLLDPSQPMPMGDPDDDMPPMTAEELQEAQAEMEAVEAEQFAALEARMGRPLTEQEKQSVRQEMARQAQSMTSLEVEPILQEMAARMSQFAAVHLGLMPNPYTRLIAKNDTQARLAIDAFAAVFEVIKPQLDAASQREYARVLNDLRVNFSSITGATLGSAPSSGPSRIIH